MYIYQVYANMWAAANADDMVKKGLKACCYQIAAVGFMDRDRYLGIVHSLTGMSIIPDPRKQTRRLIIPGKKRSWQEL